MLADLQSVTLDEAEPGPHVFDELQTHLFGKQANNPHRRVDDAPPHIVTLRKEAVHVVLVQMIPHASTHLTSPHLTSPHLTSPHLKDIMNEEFSEFKASPHYAEFTMLASGSFRLNSALVLCRGLKTDRNLDEVRTSYQEALTQSTQFESLFEDTLLSVFFKRFSRLQVRCVRAPGFIAPNPAPTPTPNSRPRPQLPTPTPTPNPDPDPDPDP